MAARAYLPFWDAVVSWRDVTYVKIANIGSGGSSEVYLTLATSGPRRGVTFAVKMFSAPGREDWRNNFMREVHVLRDCDHPAIVKVLDEGLYRDEYPFVVMEYLPQTLSKARQVGELTDRNKLSIVMQLLSALNYLSRRDPPAVHRDIKPSNIFLKEYSCVLGDFGLILQLDASSRSGGATKAATRRVAEMAQYYRTPELVVYHNGGPKPPPASDVFQLGLVAAELFTGKNPLLPDSPGKPLRLDPIAHVGGPLGLSVKSLLDQMLIQDTSKRPSAADMLGQWVELFLTLCKRERADEQVARMRLMSKPPPSVAPSGKASP
jgi:serine/threonine-protein kinase